MKYLAILEKIFSKKALNEDTERIIKSLTNFTEEDFQELKSIASGNPTTSEDKVDPKSRSFLDLVDKVFGRSFEYGENSPQTRKQLYQIYDEMDEEVAYISAALDIISDDAVQPDQDGVIIHVTSSSEKVRSLTQDLIDNFDIEGRISKWARSIAKYGDLFIHLKVSEDKGITKILDNVYPSRVERRDYNGELLAFAETDEGIQDDIYPPWEYVHFKHKGDISKDTDKVKDLSGSSTLKYDLSGCYGESILRSAIKVYAQLRFVENMLLLSRLTNSVRRNIFMINVGDVAPDKAFETITNYANLLKKNISLDLNQGMYNSQKKTVQYDEDIFIPVADPKNDVRIEQVGGDVNISEQYDLEYLLNKLFSAIKVPKAYLNYEQDLNARSTLIQLDIRYARSVAGLQQTIRGGLLRLAYINLAFNDIDPAEVDLDIQLTSVSTIDSEAKRQESKDKLELASSMWRTICDINDKLSGGSAKSNPMAAMFEQTQESSEDSSSSLDLKYAAKMILANYLDISNEDISKLFKESPKVDKSNETSKNITVVFRRKPVSDPDIHAPYPIEESIGEFEKLRESYKKNLNTSEDPNSEEFD